MLTKQQQQMRQAYHTAASALKETGLEDGAITEQLKDLREKCGIDAMDVALWKPFGGATSFNGVDTWERGVELRQEYDELNYQLRSLMSNVLEDESLNDAQRAAAISGLADEFATRAAAIPAEVDGEDAGEADDDEDEMEMSSTERKSVTVVRPGFWSRFTRTKANAKPAESLTSTFKAFKVGDTWRWFAVYSNKYYDRENQVFPEQSHKDFVKWVDSDPTHRLPELWHWHQPIGLAEYKDGRKGMGRADVIDYDNGLAIAAGFFYPEFNYAAEALSQEKDLGVSHGYEYPDRGPRTLQPDGSYPVYYTFEVSPLPRDKAANEVTLFLPVGQKEIVTMKPATRAHLVGIHGEAKVKEIESNLDGLAKSLKAAGVSYKDLEDEATPSPTPDPSAGTSPAPGSSVPPADGTPAGGNSAEEEGIKAVKEATLTAIKEAFAPIEATIAELKDRQERLEGYFGPRTMPNPARAPSASAPIVDGRTKEGIAAKAGDKDMDPAMAGVPEHLRWYLGNTVTAVQQAAAPVSA